MKINFQTNKNVLESNVTSQVKWDEWVDVNLATRGHKTFLLMSGSIQGTEKPSEIFITSSIEDI